MSRALVLAAAAALMLSSLLLWARFGVAVALSDPGWLCLGG